MGQATGLPNRGVPRLRLEEILDELRVRIEEVRGARGRDLHDLAIQRLSATGTALRSAVRRPCTPYGEAADPAQCDPCRRRPGSQSVWE
ncbi:hypothetical protein ACWC5F_31900 [Streptomyces sp. NPDC001272]